MSWFDQITQIRTCSQKKSASSNNKSYFGTASRPKTRPQGMFFGMPACNSLWFWRFQNQVFEVLCVQIMLLFNEEPFVSIDISDILKIELLDSFKIQLNKCNGCCAIEPTNLFFFMKIKEKELRWLAHWKNKLVSIFENYWNSGQQISKCNNNGFFQVYLRAWPNSSIAFDIDGLFSLDLLFSGLNLPKILMSL